MGINKLAEATKLMAESRDGKTDREEKDKILNDGVKIPKFNPGEIGERALNLESFLKELRSSFGQISDLADKFDVSRATISSICNGQRWAWLE